MKFLVGWLLIASFLTGCSTIPNRSERLQTARETAPAGHRETIIETGNYDLLSFVPSGSANFNSLTIFIEGDGYAWFNKTKPAQDPTPITHLVLGLLRVSSAENTAYLARPCQFLGPTNGECSTHLWTGGRYSEHVVSAMNEAVNRLKLGVGASQVVLVGHSGGGTIATLIAARRTDVTGIITLAAPLDIAAFTEHHNVAQMGGSLNPVDIAASLSNIPQIHFYGDRDDKVPASVALGYLDALDHKQCTQLVTVSATHWSGWTALDPSPGEMTPTCKASQL